VETLEIKGERERSRILVGESLDNLLNYIPKEQVFIITDETVHRLYGHRFPSVPVLTIGEGEGIKNLDTVNSLYEQLLDSGVDRTAYLVAIGGGIVCDIAGFVASTYLRGIRFGFVSTTLLSQVDASVGGKNGVNFGGYKNIIGCFNQPDFVICDPDMLKTLEPKEIRCGLAEIVKHAAIKDSSYFNYIESHAEQALALERSVIEQLVYRSVSIKADVVNQDEREKGERRKLNFGHTFGHAVEKVTGVPHGEAVSIGMTVAARLSTAEDLLASDEQQRIERLLQALSLPTSFTANKEQLKDALAKDKKREGSSIHFILLDTIGHALVKEIDLTLLEAVLDDMC
jgi:3-dehydroquinate synthase